MTPNLSDLLERVRSAEGPDRTLDRAVLSKMGIHDWAGRMSYRDGPMWIDFGSSEITASVDAALALVERLLPGSMKRVFDNPDDGSSRAEIVSADGVIGRGDHDTWPLAILAALLSALQASPAAMENADDDK